MLRHARSRPPAQLSPTSTLRATTFISPCDDGERENAPPPFSQKKPGTPTLRERFGGAGSGSAAFSPAPAPAPAPMRAPLQVLGPNQPTPAAAADDIFDALLLLPSAPPPAASPPAPALPQTPPPPTPGAAAASGSAFLSSTVEQLAKTPIADLVREAREAPLDVSPLTPGEAAAHAPRLSVAGGLPPRAAHGLAAAMAASSSPDAFAHLVPSLAASAGAAANASSASLALSPASTRGGGGGGGGDGDGDDNQAAELLAEIAQLRAALDDPR